MSFPNVPWQTVKQVAYNAIESWGVLSTFTLRGGSTFSIKTTRAVPSSQAAVENLTAGIQQYELKMLVPYDPWHNAAGASRPPQKGDIVLISGRTHAVETCIVVEAGGVKFGYDVRVKG
jgi:hypothetical protein